MRWLLDLQKRIEWAFATSTSADDYETKIIAASNEWYSLSDGAWTAAEWYFMYPLVDYNSLMDSYLAERQTLDVGRS